MTTEQMTEGHLYIPPEYDELRDAIFALWTVLEKRRAAYPPPISEFRQRQAVLQNIDDEVLSGRPFSVFSAAHLKMLELLISYWRELEVDGEPQAPEPDDVLRRER